MTIPRLELCAAVVAVQIDQMLRKELELSLKESVFWTDSMSVLQYIRNESTTFHTFVANQLGIIHDGWVPSQWRYVNSQLNPADDTSRGASAQRMVGNVRWLKGPQFLWQEDFWPPEPSNSSSVVSMDDPELKRQFQAHHITGCQEELEPLDVMINRYSSWFRLKKAITWLLRFKEYLIKRQTQSTMGGGLASNRQLTLEEIQIAERKLINYVQRQTFGEVMSTSRSDNLGAQGA